MSPKRPSPPKRGTTAKWPKGTLERVGELWQDGSSLTAITRETGVPSTTICNWAKRDNWQRSEEKITERLGVAQFEAWLIEKRQDIRRSLAEAAFDSFEMAKRVAAAARVERLDDTDYSTATKNWMMAGAIGLDKLRLELGEVTGREVRIDEVQSPRKDLSAKLTDVERKIRPVESAA